MTLPNPKERRWIACTALSMCVSSLMAGAVDASEERDAETVRWRVQYALDADDYLYAAHIQVSVEKNRIVLQGFVFSDWDLQDALRVAWKAAGRMPVIDDLTIKEGGRR